MTIERGTRMKKPSMRDIIADTALEKLSTKLVEDLTVAEIIRDIGISNRTFYNHFRDKFDVCNYIYDRMLDRECWVIDGRRSSLSEFFEKFTALWGGKYSRFFFATAFYYGQDNLQDYIVSRGVEDLKQQLVCTGNEHLITGENLSMLEFYMRGLAGTTQYYVRRRMQVTSSDVQLDMTRILPTDLYEALTAEPILMS